MLSVNNVRKFRIAEGYTRFWKEYDNYPEAWHYKNWLNTQGYKAKVFFSKYHDWEIYVKPVQCQTWFIPMLENLSYVKTCIEFISSRINASKYNPMTYDAHELKSDLNYLKYLIKGLNIGDKFGN